MTDLGKKKKKMINELVWSNATFEIELWIHLW